ncbi:MAG: hypothetical protein ABIN89_27080, partial [Chitinophagaceae bacterium]
MNGIRFYIGGFVALERLHPVANKKAPQAENHGTKQLAANNQPRVENGHIQHKLCGLNLLPAALDGDSKQADIDKHIQQL